MEGRRYLLTITGVVKFEDEDAHIENLLKGDRGDDRNRVELAIIELEEYAEELQVKMELKEEG